MFRHSNNTENKECSIFLCTEKSSDKNETKYETRHKILHNKYNVRAMSYKTFESGQKNYYTLYYFFLILHVAVDFPSKDGPFFLLTVLFSFFLKYMFVCFF